MNFKKIYQSEIKNTHQKTLKLINEIPFHYWLQSPKVLNTNVNWQVGHIIIANYLHGIASITGANDKVRALIDIKSYVKYYGLNSDPTTFYEYKPDSTVLINQLKEIFNITLETLENTDFNNLEMPTEINNPGAKTKLEALLWLNQHQSWHNGQIALLKRILN